MKKIYIYAEGQTEERFIKDLLASHLARIGIYVQPVVATTKMVKAGSNFKGGIGSYHKAKKEILRLLADNSASAVSTMLDYYGLDPSFPGRSHKPGGDCYDRVKYVEQALLEDIGDQRFLPFLTLHEFEGILFASPEGMAAALPGGQGLEQKFDSIRMKFRTPEEINDQAVTAPHRRIIAIYPNYNKPLHGSLIAARIGLGKIRSECPHFDKWLSNLEEIGR